RAGEGWALARVSLPQVAVRARRLGRERAVAARSRRARDGRGPGTRARPVREARALAMLEGLRDALDARTGYRSTARALLDLPVPGGARLAYGLATAIAALCLLQALTGVVLAFAYAPSVTSAWASIVFLEEKVPLGRLVRGVHAWGAEILLVLLLVH